MKVEILDTKIPIALLTDIMPEKQYHSVLKEMKWFFDSPFSLQAENRRLTGAAIDEYGNTLKTNLSLMVGSFLNPESYRETAIFNVVETTLKHIIHDTREHWMFSELSKYAHKQQPMISYYDDGKEYKEHWDVSKYTVLIWLSEKENTFTGGELYLSQLDKTIEFKPNTGIFFPSRLLHKVNPTKITDNSVEYPGRFTLTGFVSSPTYDEMNYLENNQK